MSPKIITIENCTGDTFHHLCPMTWLGLQTGPEENVRSCNKCKKDVYICLIDEELQLHISLSHCIAIDNIEKIKANIEKHQNALKLNLSKPYIGYIKPPKK